jgi:hypothetical protein
VLLLLFGSSAAGKTFTLARLRRSPIPGVAIHDFDEIGVPPLPTVASRHEANERWVQSAIEAERQGVDLLIAAQTPLGEMAASPSAWRVRIRGCLLDCDDRTRIARLQARGEAWLAEAGGSLEDYVEWGRWMRGHAGDPGHRLEVIRNDESLAWERLQSREVTAGWPIPVVDTTRPIADVVAQIRTWVAEERALRDRDHDAGLP